MCSVIRRIVPLLPIDSSVTIRPHSFLLPTIVLRRFHSGTSTFTQFNSFNSFNSSNSSNSDSNPTFNFQPNPFNFNSNQNPNSNFNFNPNPNRNPVFNFNPKPNPNPNPDPDRKWELYQAPPSVVDMSPEEVNIYRKKHKINISGQGTIPNPGRTFQETGLPDYLQKLLVDFAEPMPIQAQGIPVVLQGRDVIGLAQTGSGKTLAYLLPAFAFIREIVAPPTSQKYSYGKLSNPTALILLPTRELTQQVESEASKFGNPLNIYNASLFGGSPRGGQIQKLKITHSEIIEATPGRLIEFLGAGFLDFSRLKYLVIDEADRMLDMGFMPQIREILTFAKLKPQILMFSATWPREVQQLAADFFEFPITIECGSQSSSLTANPDVIQHFLFPPDITQLRQTFLSLYASICQQKVLVFCNSKRDCDLLSFSLNCEKYENVYVLHSDKTQPERDSAIQAFRTSSTCTLIATDVASRGLDIKDVRYVVNYQLPYDPEDYIHRIGRTGRAGIKGEAFSFVLPQNSNIAKTILKVLQDINQPVPPELLAIAQQETGQRRFPKFPLKIFDNDQFERNF